MAMAPPGLTLPWGRAPSHGAAPLGRARSPRTDAIFKAFASCVWPKSPTLLSQEEQGGSGHCPFASQALPGGTPLLWAGGERTARSLQHGQGCFLAVRLGSSRPEVCVCLPVLRMTPPPLDSLFVRARAAEGGGEEAFHLPGSGVCVCVLNI